MRDSKGRFINGNIPWHFKGRIKDSFGYIKIHMPNHPFADKQGRVKEHRYIVEQNIGRYLTRKEVVHHINGIKDDNRIENLQLLNNQATHLKIEHPRRKECNTSTHRQCQKCNIIKELSINNFYNSKSCMYGFTYICRNCNKEISKVKWQKYKESINK